jgi:hypothetical protein
LCDAAAVPDVVDAFGIAAALSTIRTVLVGGRAPALPLSCAVNSQACYQAMDAAINEVA